MRPVRTLSPALVLVAAVAACSPAGSGSAAALFAAPIPRTLAVSSPDFPAGGMLPVRFTCDGEGISPSLAWSGVPEGTAELAVVVDDPDAPGGVYLHWVIFGLPPGLGGLASGVLPAGAGRGTNSAGGVGYRSPCPPGGGAHTYRFAVYALGERLALADGVPGGEALDAIREAALAAGVLTAVYGRG